MIADEERLKRGLPDIHVHGIRVNGGLLGDEVLRVVLMMRLQAFAQVVCGGGRVQQEFIRVQLTLVDLQHGPGFLQGGGDVFGIPALDGVVAVCDGNLVLSEGPHLRRIHRGGGLLAAHGRQQLPRAVLRHLLGHLFDLGFRFLQLACCELLCHSLGLGFRLFPEAAVVDKVIR